LKIKKSELLEAAVAAPSNIFPESLSTVDEKVFRGFSKIIQRKKSECDDQRN
jgi:hypothetical protein